MHVKGVVFINAVNFEYNFLLLTLSNKIESLFKFGLPIYLSRLFSTWSRPKSLKYTWITYIFYITEDKMCGIDVKVRDC